ncbi:unnamed protein product [Rangifer tarandus platyrhynchus]|uniref:Uncharacterized protein n=2 Tax=Rangifer tarandus platyrhynchus TaxID=3082113 RepID=A0ABN8XY69_RANTA|nr:unnamed protein product [Rangifer tarandus platyrhynchus]CAI9713136.1 unnamed protein product [Rangifer tarandus platyrhynchus]
MWAVAAAHVSPAPPGRPGAGTQAAAADEGPATGQRFREFWFKETRQQLGKTRPGGERGPRGRRGPDAPAVTCLLGVASPVSVGLGAPRTPRGPSRREDPIAMRPVRSLSVRERGPQQARAAILGSHWY